MAKAKAKEAAAMLSIRRAGDRATGALHTSVGRVTSRGAFDVPADEAQAMIDLGLAVLVGPAAVPDDDDAAGPDAPAAT